MRVVSKTYGLVVNRSLPAVKRWYGASPPVLRRQALKAAYGLRRRLGRLVAVLLGMGVSALLARVVWPEAIPDRIVFGLVAAWGSVVLALVWPRTGPLLLAVWASGVLAWGILFAAPARVATTLLGGAFLAIVWRRLEFGIIAVMLLAASIMYPGAIPKPFTVGGQGLGITEMLVFFMLVVVLVRCAADRKFEFFKSPITMPLLLLFGAILLSIVVSYAAHLQNPRGPWRFPHVYNQARPLFHYLLFFVVAFGIQTERQLNLILRVLIWTAVVVSFLMMVQYFLGTSGPSVFIGRAGALTVTHAVSPEEQGVARSLPPGLPLMVIFFFLTLTNAAYRGLRSGAVSAVAAAILGMGLIFSFTRNLWVLTLVGILVVWAASARPVKRRLSLLVLGTLAVAILGSVSVATLAPGAAGRRFSKALSERFFSTFQAKTFRSSSLQDRFRENRYAINQIKEHPVFGIGVGTPVQYKAGADPWKGTTVITPIYWIHNSYLELWMVYGLLGFVSFTWLAVAFLVRGFLLFRRAREPAARCLGIACTAQFVTFLGSSTVSMTILHQVPDMVAAALVWGIVEASWRLNEQAQAERKENERHSHLNAVAVGA